MQETILSFIFSYKGKKLNFQKVLECLINTGRAGVDILIIGAMATIAELPQIEFPVASNTAKFELNLSILFAKIIINLYSILMLGAN